MAPWRRWGPYVAERAWGTVREDYSADGDAWAYFPHDHARSRAYRWGEDGLAAICDRYQSILFSLALWNGCDPFLKERAFGLIPSEANHGEDVKEYYFYLDNVPTHSYMKYLYKYPQSEFPYKKLVKENKKRTARELEYELIDTGVFEEDRYFDVVVEYAKASQEDICIRIEAFNRGPEPAPLFLIPQLWFRKRWGWSGNDDAQPIIRAENHSNGVVAIVADDTEASFLQPLNFDYRLGKRFLYGPSHGKLLFTNNETNNKRIWNTANTTPYVKDAFHRHIVNGEECVNPANVGTKACLVYEERLVPPGKSVVIKMRLTDTSMADPLADVDRLVAREKGYADEFYASVAPKTASEEEKKVQRQAFASILWGKQVYLFDVHKWLSGDNPKEPPPEEREKIRNTHWKHLNSMRILSMPDTWEYPWFAAWDLVFHCTTFAVIDPEFAKEQLWLLLFEQFQHPNGQIPAYEWDFSDLNPPVHAWGIWRVYNMERVRKGKGDRFFLEKCFHKLLINFAWWVNKVDRMGNNVFEGGFLGLDNISVIDRSKPLGRGIHLEQCDGTGWIGMFCLNMMRIALELARENAAYESLAVKFFEHYVYVGAAMKSIGGCNYQLWDEKDNFFYDVMTFPDGHYDKFRVRSLVGLIPLYAIERLEEEWLRPFPEFKAGFDWFLTHRKDLVSKCVTTLGEGADRVHVLAIMNPDQIRHILERVWDEKEFLSDYGVRSLSKYHEEHPFVYGKSSVNYEPGESVCMIKGGNSNWRGPIWLPMNFLMIESLRKLKKAYGNSFVISDPNRPGKMLSLAEISQGLAERLIKLFLPNNQGKRPIYDNTDTFQTNPYWKDLITFYEYFHGDTGRGLGASHQTGWSALVANLIDEWRE
ncbi:glucosidase [Simkania negevensis]|uniref:Glucosidase n=1 Tax=Simkania negevensis TaxID=83561 RepID=A0ABS3AV84_9BACT|nr:glucosidase [Simkania negevensis]